MGYKVKNMLFYLKRAVCYKMCIYISYIVNWGGVCPCCNSKVKFYMPYGTKKLRMNAECPYCRGAERDRIEALYFKKIQIDKFSTVLHFAPEKWLYDYFTKLGIEKYWPVDIDENMEGVKKKVDITQIPFEDNSFDIIICNQVLEHVFNAEKAMQELARVLKTTGYAIITVPINEKKKTLEREEYNTDQLRIKYYGEANHVRMYGNDFSSILKKNGLLSEKVYAKQLSDNLRINGLKKGEYFWICKKDKSREEIKC